MRHCSWGRLTIEAKYLAHTNFNSNASLENIYKRAPLLPPSTASILITSLITNISSGTTTSLNTSSFQKDTYTMLFNFFTSLLALSALIIQAAALPATTPNLAVRAPLGINCRGSSECNFHGSTNMAKILGYVDGIDTNRMYDNGVHIACVNTGGGHGICAFLQNSDHKVSGGVIKELITGLVNHSCKNCGSNPVYNYGGSPSNNPQWGILTVNYVYNTDNPCNGLCG